jgi:AraC-like DNA-binding protein
MLVIVIIGLIFTSYLQKTQTSYIDKINAMQLDRIHYLINNHLKEANRLSNEIEKLPEFTPVYIKSRKLQSSKMIDYIRNTVTGSIKDIIIYYGDDSQFLTFNGFCSAETLNGKYRSFKALLTSLKSKDILSFYNSEEFKYINGKDHILLAIPSYYLVCTYIFEEEDFWGSTGVVDGDYELIFIYDRQNKLISSSDNNYAAIGEEIAVKLETMPSECDLTVNGVIYSSLKKAGVNDITILRLMNKSRFLAPIYTDRQFLFILLLVTLFCGSILAIVAIERAYKPMRKLLQISLPLIGYGSSPGEKHSRHLNEISLIQSSLEKLYQENIRIRKNLHESTPALFDYFVSNVIRGRFYNVSDMNDACKYMGVKFTYAFFCVCIIVSDSSALDNAFISELDMCRNLHQLLPPEIEGYFCCGGFDYIREKCFLGVLCFDNDERVSINNNLITLRDSILRQYGIRLTISYGDQYEDISMLPKSYISARFALKYRFLSNADTVIPPSQMALVLNTDTSYPYQEIIYFKETLSLWKVNDIYKAMSRIMEHMRKAGTTLLLAEYVCIDIISIFIKQAKSINREDAAKIGHYFDLFFISEFSSTLEIDSIIRLVAKRIGEFAGENINTLHNTHRQAYIDYLNENMGNCQFTVTKMANDFYVSSQYLRKTFKSEVGSNLLDFFTDVKMEKAKQMLTCGDMSIKDIVTAIGYADTSNFIRKFKLSVGLTPGQYRDKYFANKQ